MKQEVNQSNVGGSGADATARSGADATTSECPECETLKLLAREQLPAGLEQRVLARLRAEARMPRRTWWQMRTVWASGVAVVMASAWVGVLHTSAGVSRNGGAKAQMTQPASGRLSGQPSASGPNVAGSFGTAGSMRVPPTVKPMYVPAPPRRKLQSAKAAAKSQQPKSSVRQTSSNADSPRP